MAAVGDRRGIAEAGVWLAGGEEAMGDEVVGEAAGAQPARIKAQAMKKDKGGLKTGFFISSRRKNWRWAG
jgi:hypothetical protein